MKRNKTALDTALHLLGYRAQSEKEIRTKLRQRGYAPGEIEETVKTLCEHHYLDDEDAAGELFEYYRREGLYGNRYIRQKMQMRGLPCDFALTPEEEKEKATEALRKKEATNPGYRENYKRAFGFLARRGFSFEAIRHAMECEPDAEYEPEWDDDVR